MGPRKNSPAGMLAASSAVPASSTSVPSATATRPISAVGSALAIEPPTVPRRLVGG